MKLFISAGDPSGDIRMAEVLAELSRLTDTESSGLGGDHLACAGMNVEFHLSDYSVMGFTEVISSLQKLRKLRKRMKSRILDTSPDAIILVDYPGFNIPLARWASSRGIKVIYFISPQLWAWGKRRIKKIRKYVDLMIPLFEFEEKFYHENSVRAIWGGHPIVDSIPDKSGTDGEYLALLPGSRGQEIKKLLPEMISAFDILRKQGIVSKAVVASTDDISVEFQAEENRNGEDSVLCTRPIHEALAMAKAAVVCSGTATLETALLGVPFVIVYKTSALTWLLARIFVRDIQKIGMVNIVTGKDVAIELLQSDVSPENIAQTVAPLMRDSRERTERTAKLNLVREALGPPGASQRIAEIIAGEMNIEV